MYNVFVNEGGDPHQSRYQRQENQMTAKIENAFSMGKQNGINWATVCGNAAEVDCEHGEVRYRGEFVATMFNDEDGGDVLDMDGRPMTDAAVQERIYAIDRECLRVEDEINSDDYERDADI